MDTDRYFDWAATSPPDAAILSESLRVSLESFANPSSPHTAGGAARRVLEEAREVCASALGVRAEQLFFTSGGTESDALPLLSVLADGRRGGRVVVSAIEHPAVRAQCEMLVPLGFEVVSVRPDKSGFVRPESVAEKVTPDTLAVFVMAVNNETGCVQPVREISDALASFPGRKPHFHVDCVQAAGKIPLPVGEWRIGSAAFSAHKMSGPRGAGLLYLREPGRFRPFLAGGGQERNVRSGTENVFGAVALSKCLQKYFFRAETERLALQRRWTADFIASLASVPCCRLVPEERADVSGRAQGRFSPWIVQAAFLGIPGQVMVRALDARGFSVSTGSACSARRRSRPVLLAMGEPSEVQDAAVRFSFGVSTTKEGMDALAGAVREVCAELAGARA